MLMTISARLRSGLVGATVALVPVTYAAAQYAPPAALPRTCTIALSNSASVNVIAGPDANASSGLAAEFPKNTTCTWTDTSGSHTGACLEWDYQFTWQGVNPSQSVVSASADVTVLGTSPSSTVILPIVGDSSTGFGYTNGGEVGFRFNQNATTYESIVFTPVSVAPGIVTAGAKSGKYSGFCQIAGADNPVGNPDLSRPTTTTSVIGGCTIQWTLSADGCVTGATATGTTADGGTCTVVNTNNTSDTSLQSLQGITKTASCGTQINVIGSQQVCYYNSTIRAYTCVTY